MNVKALYLEKWVTGNDTQKPLEALSASLNHFVREPVREDLSRKRGNIDPCRLALKNIAECLEVGIAPANERVT